MSSESNNSKKNKHGAPPPSVQERKLAVAESGWMLAGSSETLSRTRGKRKKDNESPPVRAIARSPQVSGDCDTTVSGLSISSSSSGKKPPSSRVIVDVDPMIMMLETHLSPCPKCGARLKMSFPTVCVASGCRLTCPNFGLLESDCSFIVNADPISADITRQPGDNKIGRNTDHAINILFVLAFVACGDGGTEAARILGLLGLPNSTTMQSRSFGNIESDIGPIIRSHGDRIIYDNLCKEIKMHFGDRVDESTNEPLYDLWLARKLPERLWPRIKAGTDMGWQQKGSGRRYNSQSGHCFFIAERTRMVIAKALCSKACSQCKSWYTCHPVTEEPPPHDCTINHEGSSGSMEPIAVLQLYEQLYAQHVIVDVIVCDDDSSIKAKLKWSNADHMTNNNTTAYPMIINSKGNLVRRPNKGGLPAHMPEPSYVADPNHRRKTLAGELYALKAKAKIRPEVREAADKKAAEKKEKKEAEAAMKAAGSSGDTTTNTTSKNTKKDEEDDTSKKKKKKVYQWNKTMTGMDCMRISKNFAFMARTLEEKKTDKEIINAGKAVLEHHFDNHCYCGLWCRRQLQDEEERKKHYYRSKTDDKELYEELDKIVSRFVTLEALKEVAHSMDTLANESMNNTISWLAPKNKVYCGTQSLAIRIAMAIGITSLGTVQYYTEIFRLLGIRMTEDVAHWLQVKDSNRSSRLAKVKTQAFKRKRKQRYYDKLKEETEQAKTERAKRDGVYQPGIGMDGGYGDDDAAPEPAAPQQKKKATVIDVNKTCTACGEVGHSRRTSKQCRYYTPRNKPAATVTAAPAPITTPPQQTTNEDADELDAIDAIPFGGEDGSDCSSGAAFFDAKDCYSSSDDDVGITRGVV